MYFGYGQIWTFTFVPAGFVIVMVASIALGLVYLVGASGGRRKAQKYTSVVSYALLGFSAADLLYGMASGQLRSFVSAYGWVPMIEMSALSAMCVGSMWLMASAYVRSKQDE